MLDDSECISLKDPCVVERIRNLDRDSIKLFRWTEKDFKQYDNIITEIRNNPKIRYVFIGMLEGEANPHNPVARRIARRTDKRFRDSYKTCLLHTAELNLGEGVFTIIP